MRNEPKWLDPNVPSRIYDIGYGITTQMEFIERLKMAFPDGDAVVVDIRKQGSGSRNAGDWANWGSEYMGETVKFSGNTYLTVPSLANKHGNTKAGLLMYRDELIGGWKRSHLDVFVGIIKDKPMTKFCLMCCERKPFKGAFTPRRKLENGGFIGWESWKGGPNCHRVTLGFEITQRMRIDHNLEWFIKHLYTARGK